MYTVSNVVTLRGESLSKYGLFQMARISPIRGRSQALKAQCWLLKAFPAKIFTALLVLTQCIGAQRKACSGKEIECKSSRTWQCWEISDWHRGRLKLIPSLSQFLLSCAALLGWGQQGPLWMLATRGQGMVRNVCPDT